MSALSIWDHAISTGTWESWKEKRSRELTGEMPSSDTWLTKPEILRNDGSPGFSPLQSQIDIAIICSSSSVRLADRLPLLVPATTSRLVEIKPVILSTFLPNYSDISTIIPQLYGIIQWVGNLHIAWSLLLRRNGRDIPPLSQSWPNKPAGLYCSASHQTDMRGFVYMLISSHRVLNCP